MSPYCEVRVSAWRSKSAGPKLRGKFERNVLDTETETLVKIILLLPAIRERDIVEGDDRRRELVDVLELEVQRFRDLDLYDGGLAWRMKSKARDVPSRPDQLPPSCR